MTVVVCVTNNSRALKAGRPGSERAAAPARRVGHLAPRAAAEAASTSGTAAAPPSQLLCLKEWAPTCAALAAGDQTILLRKGGIREPTFAPAARDFLLFPTAFHTEAQLLKPGARQKFAEEMGYDPKEQAAATGALAFPTLCSVTGAWTTHHPAVLELLDDLHCWTPAFLDTRLKWRGQQPVTVLELRAWRLAQPMQVPASDSMFGCFSWVVLEGQAPLSAAAAASAGGVPALDDAAFAAKQALARAQLARLADVQELPLP